MACHTVTVVDGHSETKALVVVLWIFPPEFDYPTSTSGMSTFFAVKSSFERILSGHLATKKGAGVHFRQEQRLRFHASLRA